MGITDQCGNLRLNSPITVHVMYYRAGHVPLISQSQCSSYIGLRRQVLVAGSFVCAYYPGLGDFVVPV